MRLDHLLEGVTVLAAPPDASGVEVTAVVFDSRALAPGCLFCCVRGSHADGHDFAPAAAAAGAAALLVERPLPADLPQVVVPSVRAAMAPVAANFHGHPSRSLQVVGVTGTNGKTTTTHLVSAVFEAHGWPTAVIGTLSGARTTPEAPELQARLAELRDGGRVAVAMEVSSHALVQQRADAVDFAVAVFTNLSQDHLDFHRSMDAYFEAKASLFEPSRSRTAVINADDRWGLILLQRRPDARAFSAADAGDVVLGTRMSRFTWKGSPVDLGLPGRFNVSNAIAAATAADALGVPPETVARGLSSAPPVPGRFERVDSDGPFSVIVDYAHTPDALDEVLTSARELVVHGGRVLVVFGCGGDRDAGKRPLMGEVATRRADRAFLTSDNPRSEDPLAIMAEVRAGVVARSRLVEEPDRAAAISMAIAEAQPGDVVVIAGKGHETGQERNGIVTPFDDREVARLALEKR